MCDLEGLASRFLELEVALSFAGGSVHAYKTFLSKYFEVCERSCLGLSQSCEKVQRFDIGCNVLACNEGQIHGAIRA